MESTRDEFQDLFALYGPVLLAATILVFGTALVFALRYRRRVPDGPPVPRRHDNLPLELAYVALLAVAALVLTAATFRSEDRVDRVEARPGLRVDVTGFKWGWRFVYRGTGTSVVTGQAGGQPTLVVPAGTTIGFTLTSVDVVHGFWIPWERFKRDAFPDRLTSFDLRFDDPGRHPGHCSVFCGLHHSDMGFAVDVRRPDDFRRWLAEHRGRQTT